MRDLTNNPRVTNVECFKDEGQGINLCYKIDGKPYEVQGEFEIDSNGVLHHWAAPRKSVYFVTVQDSTSNVEGHQQGCYGEGDFSWLNEPLNGKIIDDLYPTMEEAEESAEQMREFAMEYNADWAVIYADSDEIEEEEIEIKVQYFDRVVEIKSYPSCIYVVTKNSVQTINTDGMKHELTEEEWREDLSERGYDSESVDKIIQALYMKDIID